jgi:hypothetical protein
MKPQEHIQRNKTGKEASPFHRFFDEMAICKILKYNRIETIGTEMTNKANYGYLHFFLA